MIERSERRAERAIILAAGTGSRLVAGDSIPKPLKPVAGVPLLVRVLHTLQGEGIREAVVVVGYRGDQIKKALLAEPSLALRLHFVTNERYDRKNGISLLAAARYIDQDCILSMADHLYSPELVRRLGKLELPTGACALGVDYDIERCFDLDDATKVRLVSGRIVDIGKNISDYNCIDTGVFRIGPALVAELARLEHATGDCSLSDGARALADEGRFYGSDIGDGRWIDVDTPEAFLRAEAMVRVFGDTLGDEPAGSGNLEGESMELFAPTWVRAAQPYREDHFDLAASREGLLRMMSNESPFSPSERVVQAIVDAARRGNQYPTSGKDVRRRLGVREGLDESNVVLGAGSTELIDLVIRTFVAPGEEVLLSVPTFSMYEARTRVVGGIPVLVPMSEDHEFDVGGVISAVTERTKIIFLCTPNNPTGNRLDEATLRRILRLGLPTAIDEAYYELGDTADSLAYLLAEFPNAIIIRTFSKAFGLAGMRLGYALAHAAVVKLLMRSKVPWNVSSITLAAAAAAIDDVAEFEQRTHELKQGRKYLQDALSRIRGLSVLPTDAGNFVLVDVSGTAASAHAVVDAMLAAGVFIRLLSVHHAKKSFVRITVGTDEQNVRCVQAMRDVVAGLGIRSGVVASDRGASPVGMTAKVVAAARDDLD